MNSHRSADFVRAHRRPSVAWFAAPPKRDSTDVVRAEIDDCVGRSGGTGATNPIWVHVRCALVSYRVTTEWCAAHGAPRRLHHGSRLTAARRCPQRLLTGPDHSRLDRAPVLPTAAGWGSAAPLGLLALGVTTFMLSMINADAISPAVQPVVFGVALMFGGIVELISAVIALRTGETFMGAMFGSFAGLYLSLFAFVQWFAAGIPAAQAGHALGLFLYAFGILAIVMFAGSFRTSVAVVLTLAFTVLTLFFLGAGNYGADTTVIHWGGYFGLATTACVFYLALAAVCEIAYGRSLFPVWHLDKR